MRKYALKKDREDLRDLYYRSSFKNVTDLPKIIDMRSQMSPVVDQGDLGSCTANAIVSGLREYLEIATGSNLVLLSRLFLYYQERLIEGTVHEDSGATLRDGMKVLNTIGVCPEEDEPYDIDRYTEPPSDKDIQDATNYKISSYQRIINLNALKAALAEGLPVVFGFSVYQSFESDTVAQTGKIPMPENDEQLLGGHAVLAVGYDDTDDQNSYLIIRNSWGKDWGDNGYCYMPYPVFNKLVLDMWTGK
jgi:C1A family cysteine protease